MSEPHTNTEPFSARIECLHLSNHERDRLDRLYKRMLWLEKRIENAKMQGKSLGYDEAEHSALQWAIRYIEDADTLYYLYFKNM